MNSSSPDSVPLVSVVILNYNGARWMERCLASLKEQTIFSKLEIIVADNQSSDGSDKLAEKLLQDWPNAQFVQNGGNFGYCEGNNLAVKPARGEFLFILNNDTWLERDCMEILLRETQAHQADASTPLVLNYDDDSYQSMGAQGVDIFGLASFHPPRAQTHEILMPSGSCFLIRRELFLKVGGFDKAFFMFGDEMDLSWKLWIAGGKAVAVPAAILHHRSAASVNPKGGGTIVEIRTNDTKRYYSNRNSLLVILKNAQHVLLLLAVSMVCFFIVEGLVLLILIRRWSFVRNAYIRGVTDCWKMRAHVLAERRKVKQFRKRSDWGMLRFVKMRMNRWDEMKRLKQLGLPKVDAG